MKTFNKTYLPDSIIYNWLKYTLEQSCANANSSKYDVMDLTCQGKKVIQVNVLSKNLKGKMDFFGQLYKPTSWLFTFNIIARSPIPLRGGEFTTNINLVRQYSNEYLKTFN